MDGLGLTTEPNCLDNPGDYIVGHFWKTTFEANIKRYIPISFGIKFNINIMQLSPFENQKIFKTKVNSFINKNLQLNNNLENKYKRETD